MCGYQCPQRSPFLPGYKSPMSSSSLCFANPEQPKLLSLTSSSKFKLSVHLLPPSVVASPVVHVCSSAISLVGKHPLDLSCVFLYSIQSSFSSSYFFPAKF